MPDHYRKDLRNAAKAALASHADYSGHTHVSIFEKSLDHKSLPFIAVGTPRERRQTTSLSEQDAAIDLVFILKRKGGDDLEDLLDDESAVIEDLLIEALGGPGQTQLNETLVAVDGAGESRVGSLTMTFSVSEFLSL